jgi:hypothetical protein
MRHLVLPALILCLVQTIAAPASGIAAPAATLPDAAAAPTTAWHTIISNAFVANMPGVWPVGNRDRFNEHVYLLE